MIGYLSGKVIHRAPNWLIVETGGVGYKVFVPVSLETGNSAKLYIYHHTREEASDLFGFAEIDQLMLFEQLITVSGVGPKAALNILSSASDDKVREAIIQGDTGLFKAIAGIGPKMAAKIIVELQSKISGGHGAVALDTSSLEVVDALISLGYKQGEVTPLLSKMPKDLTDASAKIKWLLKQLSK